MSIIDARRSSLTLISSALIALVSIGCSSKPPQATIRYRVTAIVEENGVQREGSAVWSTTLTRPFFSLVDQYGGKFSGDAVPISLSDGAVMLIMLNRWSIKSPKKELTGYSPNVASVPFFLFGKYADYRGDDKIELLVAISKMKNRVGHLVCDQPKPMAWLLPEQPKVQAAYACFRIATVRKPNDKSTLALMDTSKIYFETNHKIKIKDIVVELTQDGVDRPLTKLLPWLSKGPDLTTPEGWRQSQLTETNPIVHGIRR